MAFENYGPGVFGPYYNAGAPVAGANAVQTLTIGGTPTGGTFRVGLGGIITAAIPWGTNNAVMLSAINNALNQALGPNEIVATAGTLAAGIGTIIFTFSGPTAAKRAVQLMTAVNNLTGTSPTLAFAMTTAGVAATLRDVQPGATMVDTTGKKAYINNGTPGNPAWVVVGTQT